MDLIICDNVDRPRWYYAKGNKSDREKQISRDLTYTWCLKNETGIWGGVWVV